MAVVADIVVFSMLVSTIFVSSLTFTGVLIPNAASSLLDTCQLCVRVFMSHNLFRLIRLFFYCLNDVVS